MCGIYFCAGLSRPQPPSIFQNSSLLECFEDIGEDRLSYSLCRDEVDEIVEKDRHTQTKLRECDKKKLEALPLIRELQKQLNSSKTAKNQEESDSLQLQMDALQLQEPQQALQYSTERNLISVMARGPDSCQYLQFRQQNVHFLLLSSVLSLRQPFTKQPLHEAGLLLQYNGELYIDSCLEQNDTMFLFQRVLSAVAPTKSGKERESAILSAVADLAGEYAFVVTDMIANKVYFGKDAVGKRSLLYSCSEGQLLISSTLPNKQDAVECEGGNTYIADLQTFLIVGHSTAKPVLKGIGANLSISPDMVSQRTDDLHAKLTRACLIRQDTIVPLEATAVIRVGVLFSGGLDCTVVAALLAHNYVLECKRVVIDLLSVGFENPRTGMKPEDLPDRKVAVRSWQDLCRVFKGTCVVFQLVQIDVSYEEWLCHKQSVQDLIHPTNTEMDLSIAIAFYFACRARKCRALLPPAEPSDLPQVVEDYESPAKVLLSGLGADELFGGYSRHEGVFNGASDSGPELIQRYETLTAELAHDIDIIYVRNLGRDDRAMCTWGKELRYPYLDQLVIQFAFDAVEPNLKVKLEWVDQITKKGTKRAIRFERKHILRELARKLDLGAAAEEPKRAIQFGAKTAKMEIGLGKAKGTDSL